MSATHSEIGDEIKTKKTLSDELTAKLKAATEQYKALRK